MGLVIEVHDLVKAYGDVHAVEHLSLEVQKGTIFSLLGPTGAGKTTTVEILEGLPPATAGNARALPHDTADGPGQPPRDPPVRGGEPGPRDRDVPGGRAGPPLPRGAHDGARPEGEAGP